MTDRPRTWTTPALCMPPPRFAKLQIPEVTMTSDRGTPASDVTRPVIDSSDRIESGGMPSPMFLLRAAIGGILMGLANLVPGISGGTMLLAAGVYPEFEESVSAVTRLVRRWRPWIILAAVAIPALLAIGGLAGTVRDAVLEHRWMAYSLFIGLTLGGAPTLLRLLRPCPPRALIAAGVAFVGMVVLALVQETGGGGSPESGGGLFGLGLAGFAGAAAMVLPGVSGGYLLLVMGQYVAVLDAISAASDAVKGGSMDELLASIPSLAAIGIGVLLGIVLVSNVVRWLLRRHREVTLGVLLGLLLGAVAGLWPFRAAIQPEPGMIIRGQRIETVADAEAVPIKHRPTSFFTPGATEVIGALVLVGLGLGISLGVARLGGGESE